ncbi:hypothetical protein DMB66_49115 [Actinoplanes sp. ATCC 53533]|uniref:hypothetical protein n=1 Tax=Actinoplanes sp. ATCC 53533 TaxID=1288362 RepID=UPI000F78DF51|nr:hypothetical protein [Actinoplanes sp. ATCC 53533]RSM46798.1 hypothetical protein DMB66_49115 [Actinoplanes sp. ATCC 53533]
MDAISRQEVADAELIAPGTVHRIAAVLGRALSEARRQGAGVDERGVAAAATARWPAAGGGVDPEDRLLSRPIYGTGHERAAQGITPIAANIVGSQATGDI